jgi:hypothetical protein
VLGELVRPWKRREKGGKGEGSSDDSHFKLMHRGGGRPAGFLHVAGEGRERGRGSRPIGARPTAA